MKLLNLSAVLLCSALTCWGSKPEFVFDVKSVDEIFRHYASIKDKLPIGELTDLSQAMAYLDVHLGRLKSAGVSDGDIQKMFVNAVNGQTPKGVIIIAATSMLIETLPLEEATANKVALSMDEKNYINELRAKALRWESLYGSGHTEGATSQLPTK